MHTIAGFAMLRFPPSRLPRVAWIALLLLFTHGRPSIAIASPFDVVESCAVASIYEVPRCIRLGDSVVVRVAGVPAEVSGRFRGFADGRIVIDTGAQLLAFPAADVLSVAVRLRAGRWYSAGRGAAAGFGIGSVSTIAALVYGEPREFLEGVATSSGILAALAAVIRVDGPPRVVLSRAPGDVIPPRSPDVRASFLLARDVAELAPKLQPGDAVRVRQLGGTWTIGRFVGTDGDVLLVEADRVVRRLPSGTIASVARRTWLRPSARRGAVVGAAVGAVLSLLIVIDEHERPEANPEPLTAVDHAVGLGMCAGIGAVTTRFLGRRDELVLGHPIVQDRQSPGAGFYFRFTF